MSITHNKVIGKLQSLDEYLHYLAEHYLHLSIEIVLDVAKLIIAYGFPRPEEQGDVLRILQTKRVMSEKLYNELSGINGFRNVLIHEYERVDKARVYEYLQNDIGQFKEYKRQVLRFLRKKK